MLDKNSQEKFKRLRQLAEQILQQGASTSLDKPEDLAELVHELEVHQIELDVQHEELERAYNELEKIRQVYADLFDFAPVGYVILDKKNVMQSVNLTLATMLGVERRSLMKRTFTAFIDEEFKDIYYIHQRTLFQTGSQQRYTVFIRGTEGPGFFAYLTSEIDDANANTCRVSVTDITHVKEAEQVLQRSLKREKELNDLKTRLIAMISHEMRTPLTVMMTNVELMSRYSQKMTEGKLRQRYESLQNYLWYLNDLIDDVIIAHQSSSEELIPKYETFDLLPTLTQLIDDLNGLQNQSRIQLDIQSRLQTETVTWDMNLLRRILLNLLQNALKYSEDEVRCDVDCKPKSVTFAISDRGMGIPAEDQLYIYGMFYRGSNTSSTSGTGVGLGIVKLAVEAHKGKIHYETDNDGTTFFIKLPRHATGYPDDA